MQKPNKSQEQEAQGTSNRQAGQHIRKYIMKRKRITNRRQQPRTLTETQAQMEQRMKKRRSPHTDTNKWPADQKQTQITKCVSRSCFTSFKVAAPPAHIQIVFSFASFADLVTNPKIPTRPQSPFSFSVKAAITKFYDSIVHFSGFCLSPRITQIRLFPPRGGRFHCNPNTHRLAES